MKVIYSTVLLLLVAGCASQQKNVTSNNAELLVVGSKPEGFPKTRIQPNPNFPGFCLEVTESWKEDTYQGKTIWLIHRELKGIQCPK